VATAELDAHGVHHEGYEPEPAGDDDQPEQLIAAIAMDFAAGPDQE